MSERIVVALIWLALGAVSLFNARLGMQKGWLFTRSGRLREKDAPDRFGCWMIASIISGIALMLAGTVSLFIRP